MPSPSTKLAQVVQSFEDYQKQLQRRLSPEEIAAEQEKTNAKSAGTQPRTGTTTAKTTR